ncbi:D-aminoacyl-tRNA deacylase [Aliidiomarina quisquiliarum]|uniref:D-aminoacyl-tRNA deacylase n=1 Tax=Aliidiomarina quisquiliarum TaxID=2938947 RepID=UPI00208E862A|nr:D-aminoacyl-tRNA deacylase [Aliidiomarina quisquiliarum]MCO4322563.1 D-aminoacyl-tRNA deacylase [Aliidiomarina quisquiliarum]
MIGLIQRVSSAQVIVDNEAVATIGPGILVLLGVEHGDTDEKAQRLAARIVGYRIFADNDNKMNLDVRDISGEVLVVSQFTLAADTQKGRRPSFSSAATPSEAERLYEVFCQAMRSAGEAYNVGVQTGQFAADMQVHLVNNGPVTFQLKT